MNATAENMQNNENTRTMQDIERRYFAPDHLQDANEYINEAIAICENEGVQPIMNFDADADFPDGYGLAVIPITKRVAEQGNVTIGISVDAVPSFDLVMDDEQGAEYVRKLVQADFLRQIATASKPREDGQLTSIPFKLLDFVTSTRKGGLEAFNAVASIFVTVLKKKKLKFMTKVLLRQILSSASFAEQQYPNIDQQSWVTVLNAMIAQNKKNGIEAGVLQHWIDTRDEVEVTEQDIDLSDLGDLLS